jgi:uncharacterized membrane protein
MSFASAMDDVAKAFEALGALVLVGGVIWSATSSRTTWRTTRSGSRSYKTLRRTFGSALLLALEVLVAADLIRTVAVAPTLDNVVVLGIVVLIRTFLSFSLQVEIDGTLPWRKASPPSAASAPAPVVHDPAGATATAAGPETRLTGEAATPVANPDRPRYEAIQHRDEPPN